ncbi:MAG: adenine deaminase C-terminal domain-containing protein [Spirochaetales bacterium]|nr:adenine deaminase C-terminal domain-containing protein [Spirochaetales bacterium]
MNYRDFRNHKSGITTELTAVAMGRKAGDLIIKNIRLVNVLLGTIEEETDLIAYKGIIAYIGKADGHPVDENTRLIHGEGRYLLPGLIDSHMHVESSMVDPLSFAAAVLPGGTTTICPDIHEMTNVLGLRAVELFHEKTKDLPLNVLTAMPVCVPSLPGMEDSGAEIGPEDVKTAYDRGWADLQGEQMNFPGVIFGDPRVHAIGAEGLKADKVLTGHYSSPDRDRGLNAFIASGQTACHESTEAQEALAKAGRGMYVQMRYGSAWLDLPNLIPALLENPSMDTRFFTLVTDDVTPRTISREGHLIRVLREAVRLGLPPLKAVQMVTINAAQLLGLDRWIGSLASGRAADMFITDNLADFKVDEVFTAGELRARKGRLTEDLPQTEYPAWALQSVHLESPAPEDFAVAAPKGKEGKPVGVRVMELIPGMVFTKESSALLVPEEGIISPDPDLDLSQLTLFYRHEKPVAPEHRRSHAFVSGLKLAPGTAYASTVSHDCHNLLVLGTDRDAMARAAEALIETGGGLAVVSGGKLTARMALPFAGLMSLQSAEQAAVELEKVEKALKEAGCPHDSAEMTISLLGLVVLPELHLSNRGLVQLKEGKAPEFVDLFL